MDIKLRITLLLKTDKIVCLCYLSVDVHPFKSVEMCVPGGESLRLRYKYMTEHILSVCICWFAS
jgi:hypothetical protein